MGIRTMLGIDFFNAYNLYLSTANIRRGTPSQSVGKTPRLHGDSPV